MQSKRRPWAAFVLALGKVPLLGLYLYFFRFMHRNHDFYVGIGLTDVRLPMVLMVLLALLTATALWQLWRNNSSKSWKRFLGIKTLELAGWLYLWPLMGEHLTQVLPDIEHSSFALALLVFLLAANAIGPVWLYLQRNHAHPRIR